MGIIIIIVQGSAIRREVICLSGLYISFEGREVDCARDTSSRSYRDRNGAQLSEMETGSIDCELQIVKAPGNSMY